MEWALCPWLGWVVGGIQKIVKESMSWGGGVCNHGIYHDWNIFCWQADDMCIRLEDKSLQASLHCGNIAAFIQLQIDSTFQEPRQNPTTVQSPPSKEKKILGYFPRSPEPASAGSKADPTAALKASQEQAHDLTRGEVSSQRTENEPKESGEKQRGESKWEPAGEGGPVVGSDKEHPEKDQRKVDTGSKEKKGSKKTRIR